MRLFLALLLVCSNAFAQPAQWPGVGKTIDFITGKHVHAAANKYDMQREYF